jgi:hypothetical protein
MTPPWYLRIPSVIAFALLGVGLGVLVVRVSPKPTADEALLARMKWWEENATALQKTHRLK